MSTFTHTHRCTNSRGLGTTEQSCNEWHDIWVHTLKTLYVQLYRLYDLSYLPFLILLKVWPFSLVSALIHIVPAYFSDATSLNSPQAEHTIRLSFKWAFTACNAHSWKNPERERIFKDTPWRHAFQSLSTFIHADLSYARLLGWLWCRLIRITSAIWWELEWN